MPQIKKPLLASHFVLDKAKFPYIVTPKIDGIRFMMVNGVALSRAFKPIRNRYIQKILSESLPDGIDGELTSGENIHTTTSAVMSYEGEPDFHVWIFDYLNPEEDEILPYYLRILNMPDIPDIIPHTILSGTTVKTQEELNQIEETYLKEGFEGLMARDPFGTYKFGRSSVKENILLKVKRFSDAEAVVIDIEEKMHNNNEAQLNAFGNIKRSSSIAGMVGAGTAGKIIAKAEDGKIVAIGSGLNDELREELWNNKNNYIGKSVKYKFFEHGVKELPRHPVFIGFRHEDDL